MTSKYGIDREAHLLKVDCDHTVLCSYIRIRLEVFSQEGFRRTCQVPVDDRDCRFFRHEAVDDAVLPWAEQPLYVHSVRAPA